MIELQPNTNYCIIYTDGTKLKFCTLDKVHKAKHLIRVIPNGKKEDVDLVSLLSKKWRDIVEVKT